MSKKSKLIKKFLSTNHSFKWTELVTLMKFLGFKKIEAKGSRVNFYDGEILIKLHKPHPGNEVKSYIIKELKVIFLKENLI